MGEIFIVTTVSVFIVLFSFSPLVLSIIAAMKLHKTFGSDAILLLSIGVVSLGLLPLDFIASMAASRLDKEALANLWIFKSYILTALTFIGTISVSIGILIVCKKYQAKVKQGS